MGNFFQIKLVAGTAFYIIAITTITSAEKDKDSSMWRNNFSTFFVFMP